jgi:hypothetical protein
VSEPDRAGTIRDLGNQWLAEVVKLRALFEPDENGELRPAELPKPGDGPERAYETLLKVRASLDRVEEILSQVSAMASAARIAARELTEKADDKLDKAIVARSKRARDYEAARERLADARLDEAVFPLIVEARTAQKVADMAANVEARIRLAHRGLDGLRTDLLAALRHVSWESNLDR